MAMTLNTNDWSFSGDPVPASKVNASRLDNLMALLFANDEELNAWIAQAIRDDGLLQSRIVRLFNLAPEVLTALISAAGWKPPALGAVELATTANIALTGTVTVDGVTSGNGKRILVKDQTDAEDNGIYLSNSGGAWTRATDADTATEMGYILVPVTAGDSNRLTTWLCTLASDDITLDTTELVFLQIFNGVDPDDYRDLINALEPVVAVSTSNLTIGSPGTVIDGRTLLTGDRVLLVAQTTASQNGVWEYNGTVLIRPADFSANVIPPESLMVPVAQSTSRYDGMTWRIATTGAVVVDTTLTSWKLRVEPARGFLRSVYLASSVNISVTVAPSAIDEITPAANSRLLLYGQTDPTQNGLWVFIAAGSPLVRAVDDDPYLDPLIAYGRMVYVEAGALNGGMMLQQTAPNWTTTYTPGVTSATWTQQILSAAAVPALRRKNHLHNGRMLVRQRPAYAATVSDTLGYGKCDKWKGSLTGTAVSGTLTATDASGISAWPSACKWESVTLTGAGKLRFRQYVEAKDAMVLSIRRMQFHAYMRHDIGSTVNVTVSLYTADVADDFSAVTLRASDVTSVASGTNVPVTLGVSIAESATDIEKGFYIDIEMDCGVITNKNVVLTQCQLVEGGQPANADFLEAVPYADDLARCRRYFQSTFPDRTTPAQNTAIRGFTFPCAVGAAVTMRAAWRLPVPMIPRTATIVTYNPDAANAQVRNVTDGADCSATATTGSLGDTVLVSCTTSAAAAAGELLDVHITVDRDF